MTDPIKLPPLPHLPLNDPAAAYKAVHDYGQQCATAAIEADRQATKELLQNPVHVHANMCRGIIAPIKFDQLAHILGEEATSAWLADRQGMGALSRQQIIDRFGFLEGIVSEHNFRRIYETAIEIAAVSDRQANEPRTDADRAAVWLASELAAIIPTKDLLKATKSSGAMVAYFKRLIGERQARGEPVAASEAYDTIDSFLRNNLDDDDYALYSSALDDVYTTPQPPQIPEPAPLRESMSSNHRSYAEGWNACRAAMLEAPPGMKP